MLAAMKALRIVSILLLAPLDIGPADARRGHSLSLFGKRAWRHAAPLLIVLPPQLAARKPAIPPKVTFAPHDIAHAGPRLGVKFYENGLRVALVDQGSSAAKAGLSQNDIVREARGRSVKSHADFAAAINAAVASEKLRLSLLRKAKRITTTVSLAAPVAR